jgi:3-(3-hydroxy-phenyl)propionate hydroxylase
MTGHAVAIVGSGPTRLMLAGELALAGVDVAIVERRASQALDSSRMPDLDLVTPPLRVFTLLHQARPVLLNLGEPGGFDMTPWAARVRLVDAAYKGPWELPVLGQVTAPAAVLIRPDGHVAWAGDLTDPGLPEALTTWFGLPR